MGSFSKLGFMVVGVCMVLGCSRSLVDCGVPSPDYEHLKSLRRGIVSISGPSAGLILPNPIDVTNNPYVAISDARLASLESSVFLSNLLSPTRLESAFIKMRIRAIEDSLSLLAAPNAQGNYVFSPDTDHYSEALGYYSLSLLEKYVEGLGYSILKDRPLYVMVMAVAADGSDSINAFYDHARFNVKQPRTIRFFGNTPYKVSKDRDMFWHEFGHLVNESLSADRGIDYAGDAGASYTEAAALHECLADYGAQSLGDRPYIGRWIARNFPEYSPGDPLRSAVDSERDALSFSQVSRNPERYQVAEWCSRVLWRLREQMVAENPQRGVIDADRLVYGAVTLLERDTSIGRFRDALLEADQQLQCGVHHRSIETAFLDGGFESAPAKLDRSLVLTVSAYADPTGATASADSSEIRLGVSLSNPAGQIARNVRLVLESDDPRLVPVVYFQGVGDLLPGEAIRIFPQDLERSVSLTLTANKGVKVPFRLRAVTENGGNGAVFAEVER